MHIFSLMKLKLDLSQERKASSFKTGAVSTAFENQ